MRHVDLVGTSSCVLYSRLTSSTIDAAIQEQVAYFTGLGHELEWKAFAHDQPPDLVDRLVAHGFEVDETEAILVLDLQAAPPMPAAGPHVKKIKQTDLADIAAIKKRVDAALDTTRQTVRLAYEMDHTPDGISVYVAYVDGAPAACAWVRFPEASGFASLWGGSTVPELRNRGLYTDLLAVRVDEARARGFRYLTVDARSTSRPILEKRGFKVLTFATACTWPASAAERG